VFLTHLSRGISVFAAFVFSVNIAVAAPVLKVIHTFTNTPDGSGPERRLIQDAHGNFYGTASFGGANGQGCVFELSPNSDGSWTEKILYSFSGPDGAIPVSSLVFDRAGNLYGTTAGGGAYDDGGTAFELSPTATGWTETVIHSFGNGFDGWDPQAGMIFDSAGNLYGTTQLGGAVFGRGDDNGGTVFRLSSGGDGWTETILYSFTGEYLGPDPNLPAGSVVFASNGTIYGVAQSGGVNGKGAVYELTPNGDGTYTESVIHNFTGPDGEDPNSELIWDANGNLYGTTQGGGHLDPCSGGCGVLFKLSNRGDGSWSETVLHAFLGADGFGPIGPPALDRSGNLYAVTEYGGADSHGTVFKLVPLSGGSWGIRVLHNFTDGSDGAFPIGGLTLTSSQIFGTASIGGGSTDSGVAFVITP